MFFSEKQIKVAVDNENVHLPRAKDLLEKGFVTLPANNKRESLTRPCLIGKEMTVKVNANIGFSEGYSSVSEEMEKMSVAVEAGADTIMDLSTGPGVNEMRRKILEVCPVPVGTVPIYQLVCGGKKTFRELVEQDFIDVVAEQAEEGVDFFTIHAGLTLKASQSLRTSGRIIDVVSRGGAFLADWMLHNSKENPFLSCFDEILAIAGEYDIVLSLGDSLRPGAIADASDSLQIEELVLLGQLQKRAMAKGVQIIIEGPGHVPMDQIEANVKLQKTLCHGAPFYVLGPLVTDAACGWDHISGAIGGAIAGAAGADYLCYVTAAEHVCLPDIFDVREGVVASKIAAHAADISRGLSSALRTDEKISRARKKRLWEEQFGLAIDPKKAREKRKASGAGNSDICSMCAELCSMKIVEKKLTEKEGLGT